MEETLRKREIEKIRISLEREPKVPKMDFEEELNKLKPSS